MTATLKVLGEGSGGPVNVTVNRFDENSLELGDAPRLRLGSLVKIVQDQRLWLGEVVGSKSCGAVTVKLAHSLDNTDELARLVDRFEGSTAYAILNV